MKSHLHAAGLDEKGKKKGSTARNANGYPYRGLLSTKSAKRVPFLRVTTAVRANLLQLTQALDSVLTVMLNPRPPRLQNHGHRKRVQLAVAFQRGFDLARLGKWNFLELKPRKSAVAAPPSAISTPPRNSDSPEVSKVTSPNTGFSILQHPIRVGYVAIYLLPPLLGNEVQAWDTTCAPSIGFK